MAYVLVQWDESRAGQSDEYALHSESDGTEHKSWGSDPRSNPDLKVEMHEAIASAQLPADANLPSAADQARAMAHSQVGLQAGGYAFIRESSDTPLPWK